MAQMRGLTGTSILVLRDSTGQKEASEPCMYFFLVCRMGFFVLVWLI